METLTLQQIEELKKMEWVEALNGENNNYFMALNLADNDFVDLTGIDLNSLYDNIYLPVSNRIEYYKSSVYKNGEKFYLQYIIFVDGVEWARGNFAMFVSDELGLFTPKTEEQEEQTEENPIELLKKALKLCADKEVETSDVTSVIEDFDYLYDAIKENIIDNLGVEDLSDSLMKDAANEYIERNPSNCYERAMDNMASYEVKDKIIDYLSDNL